MDAWRSVATLVILIPFPSNISMHQVKPSLSIALDEHTSLTWTTLNATTFPVSSSINV